MREHGPMYTSVLLIKIDEGGCVGGWVVSGVLCAWWAGGVRINHRRFFFSENG